MIDWDRLTGLRAEIGAEDFREVAALFVEELSEVMERLSQDPAAATGEDFHFLRGSAANLGFRDFAAGCARAEAALAAGRSADIAGLARLYRASLDAAASLLPGGSRAA